MCGCNAANDALSGPDVTVLFERTQATDGAVHRNTRYRKGGGSCAERGAGGGPGRVFPYQKGGSCGVPGTVPGQEGGGFLCSKGVPVGFLWHFLCTSCPHNSWQASILNVMQKAVANFLGSVVRVTPYWDLGLMHGDRDGNTFATLWVLCLEMTTSLCAQPVTV